MLTLTRKTEYGLIALCHLARTGDQVVSAREIADQHKVPLPLLMNIMKQLHHKGLVRSVRGAHGGYALERPARELTLSGVIEAIEGPIRVIRCVDHEEECSSKEAVAELACELTDGCLIRNPLLKVHAQFKRFLEQVTVADLAADESVTELTTSGLDGESEARAAM